LQPLASWINQGIIQLATLRFGLFQQAVRDIPDEMAQIEIGARFLSALFGESEIILFRPIEVWTENGKKQSRTFRNSTLYRTIENPELQLTLFYLLQNSESEKANVFFGACPRFGGRGEYDQAWQIRTVRALWADIDHISVEDARERIAKSGLPYPSIIVNSGNGVHLYWLLDEPYLIDDVGDPPAVETEEIVLANGRKQYRKYFVELGERVYLDQRRLVMRLSAKAQYVQDLLAGLAKACGGDHTKDVTRLLRIPGTYNRKDERNGRPPILAELVECEPTRRYAIKEFKRFATPSPETERIKKIDLMPLPKVRKPSPGKADKLSEFVAACSVAPCGSRSEADFALCCYAIKNGIDNETVWAMVEQVGKFAEQGRRYFEVTWGNAEYEVRTGTYEKLSSKSIPNHNKAQNSVSVVEMLVESDSVCIDDSNSNNSYRTIEIQQSTTPVRVIMQQITNCLVSAKNCFIRCDQLVTIHREKISSILSPQELAGLLNQHVEFYYIEEKKSEYKPLASTYASTWLNQRVERERMPEIKLFTRNPAFTADWRLLQPGYDNASRIYYAGPVIKPLEGTKHLNELLQDFCFKSTADRTNYIGMLLTAVLIFHFIGAKPAAIFNGNQPGLGKTILAQIIAILRDGSPTETASYNSNDEEFEKRLGSIVRSGFTTIIIDNAKAHGRQVWIESACLERSITDSIISFRLLGHSVSIRVENSHIFCITSNTPNVSPDLISRSVVINLQYEGDPRHRTFHVADPEGYAMQYRIELLGELIGMVERWIQAGRPMANVKTRFNKLGWGNIIGGILAFNGEPDFLANAEEVAQLLDETRRDFTTLVELLLKQTDCQLSATELVKICKLNRLLERELIEGSPRSLATRIGTLAGRFINEKFVIDDQVVEFRRTKERKGNLYYVILLDKSAEL